MDYFDALTDQRIDSETADLVDRLLERYAASLAPCRLPLDDVLARIGEIYPLRPLPPDDIQCARTALAVLETEFPEDAGWLPHEPNERLDAALPLARSLRLDVRCLEVGNTGAGCALYGEQRAAFERRAAGYGLRWSPMPVRICAEVTTGYCLVTGSDTLADRITCLRGVSQMDIDQRTPALIAWLRAKYGADGV
ncbi:MAG TPA: hypothetical protein IAA32_05765 [Candidatus Butyricicoccus stercorigallinarum]|nr:hypothetical protein [Candidatus Butyricicoccus stercorigallinarum]